MPTHALLEFIQHIRTTESMRERTDGQLLDAFIRRREEEAIRTLVQRHGSMVWGVCCRVLRNRHDAEDAFQATFLVLVRRASSIVPREMVGNWLYGVAHQTALKARAMAAKRKGRENHLVIIAEPVAVQRNDWSALQPMLDEELRRLPDKYRVVIVLCDLEGKTRKETAQQLGWPEGTVAGRLARARARLAQRLRQRGVELSVGALAVASQEAARASVPAPLVSATLRMMSTAGQGAATGVITAKVATLAEGMVKAMLLAKLTRALMVFLLLSMVGVGAGISMHGSAAAQQEPSMHSQNGDTKAGQSEGKDNGSPNAVHPGVWRKWATLNNHHSLVYDVAFAAKERLFATAGADGTVRLWDSGTLKEKYVLAGQRGVLAVCFSPDCKIVASGGCDETIRFWDVATGKERSAIKVGQPVESLAYSPDGETVATGSGFGVVSRWNVATGMKMEPLHDPEQKMLSGGLGMLAVSVAFSPDGKLLAAGMYDHRIRLWEMPSGKELAPLKGHTAPVFDIAFSPDGKLLVSGSGDGSIKVWDMVARKEEGDLSGGAGSVQAVAFAPDGKTVAAGAFRNRNGVNNSQVELWSLATKKRTAVLGTFPEGTGSLAFSADGGILVATCGIIFAPWPHESPGGVMLWHLVKAGGR
jgi:RNA polymerase sigma factor (sigma-70 family)